MAEVSKETRSTVRVKLEQGDDVVITPERDEDERIRVLAERNRLTVIEFNSEGAAGGRLIFSEDDLYELCRGRHGEILRIEDVTLNERLAHLDTHRQTINALGDVQGERQRQDEKFGGPEHDDSVTLAEWSAKLASRAGQIEHEHQIEDVRRLLVEIAAIAVAAVESVDRRMADPSS